MSNCLSVVNDLFKAMADPTRREILRLLKEDDMCAGDIGSHFKMEAASVSHHLSILRNAGLIVSEKQGKFIIYSLNMTVFEEVMQWFVGFQKGGKH